MNYCDKCGKPIDSTSGVCYCQGTVTFPAPTIENHDWQCGCGHWNGPNLAVCAVCDRKAGLR